MTISTFWVLAMVVYGQLQFFPMVFDTLEECRGAVVGVVGQSNTAEGIAEAAARGVCVQVVVETEVGQ